MKQSLAKTTQGISFASPKTPVLQLNRSCGPSVGFNAPDERGFCLKSTPTRQAEAGSLSAPNLVRETLRSEGTPLDQGTRAFMEPRFGHDFGNVRVHDDSRAAESATAVGALAYTVGQHIVFASGQYAPANNTGKLLLAHELTHVIQQDGSESTSIAGVSKPEDPSEIEADRTAVAVVNRSNPPAAQIQAPTPQTRRPNFSPQPITRVRAATLQRARNCSAPEATLPFDFTFDITEQIYSRSFKLSADATTVSVTSQAVYGSVAPPGAPGDYCIELRECNWYGDTSEDKKCNTINGRPKSVSWSGLTGGETYYFRIWKGMGDGLSISGTGTAS